MTCTAHSTPDHTCPACVQAAKRVLTSAARAAASRARKRKTGGRNGGRPITRTIGGVPTAEYARRLGVTRQTIERRVKDGLLAEDIRKGGRS